MRLITDRAQENVLRRNYLAAKGESNMTDAEYAEWTGDPLLSDRFEHDEVVNLLPSSAVGAMIVVGAAEYFEDKALTLSVAAVSGSPLVQAYWYDEGGSEAIGSPLSASGRVTINTGENTNGRASLAVYMGSEAEYQNVMLEFGTVAHAYVPYTPIIPTTATKGAYNYSDLNRVESAVAELSAEIGLSLTTKTDWTIQDIPTAADMDDRYLENIRELRSRCAVLSTTPDAPESMRFLDWSKANDIEQILVDIVKAMGGDSGAKLGEAVLGEMTLGDG